MFFNRKKEPKIQKAGQISPAKIKEQIQDILKTYRCQRWEEFFLSPDVRLTIKQKLAQEILPLKEGTQLLTCVIILLGVKNV